MRFYSNMQAAPRSSVPYELLFKMSKTDSRLIRTILENSGFRPTESHDWNVLWINTSAKPYLYDGLNEHQRINHFPGTM